MTDGFGTITWWGFSPALDLLDTDIVTSLKQLELDKESTSDEVRVLLVGAGDIRHILTTIARSYRHPKRKFHFYILENALELYARDMLFLSIALEPQKRMGLQEKTELFLELFGNILVRKQSSEYVEKMATEFIKMVTDSDYLEEKLPMLDLSQLKFKERDFLEGIFKFWRNSDPSHFDAEKCWDLRQRQYLGVRYDNRLNAYDWDYHMKLTQRDADIIHTHEYKNWRKSGVAFEPREATYDVPNKTLASGLLIKHEGERFAKRGYWGDIIVSPYIPLGIVCEDKSFFKKSNNMYTKLSQHVAEFNILSAFHEIANKEKYIPPKVEEKDKKEEKDTGAKITEIKEEDEEENSKENGQDLSSFQKELEDDIEQSTTNPAKPLDDKYESIQLDGMKITFLPLNSLENLPKKNKYQKYFHIAYFANSLVHLLKEEVAAIFADKATVITESARYMLELKLENVAEFVKKVIGIAHQVGCKEAEEFDGEKSNFLWFTYEGKSTS